MISHSQCPRSRFFFSSLVFLLISILSGCNPDNDKSGNTTPDQQTQDDTSATGDNQPPNANITAPNAITSGQTVTLDGSGSFDPENKGLTYKWTQTKGPDIMLSNSTSSRLTFVAPMVSQATQFKFQLTVHDGELSGTATVSFLITSVEDSESPSIVDRSPQPDQSGVSTTTEIRVDFNEALLKESVDSQSFSVNLNGNPVSGTVSYDSANNTITNKPASALTPNTTYTVTLASTLEDLTGNTFAGESWSFSTAAEMVADGKCATAEEGNSLMLSCPTGQVITEVTFASYGNPEGSCGSFTKGSCNASSAEMIVSNACKWNNSCTLYAGSDPFGNPCEGRVKKLAAQVACGESNSDSVVDSSRLRVIASTDIGGSDSDDEQSMVHFLAYADNWDVEGLIASPWEDGRKEDILRIIDEYEKDYPALMTHGNYPTADYLRSVTKQGAEDKAPDAGYGEPTEGSEWIAEVAMRDDPRPLWITVWGCIDDVAQALHDHPEIMPKLRVYWIAGPNRRHSPDSSTYLAKNHKDLWIIEADETYRGFFNGGDTSGGYGNSDWPKENVQGHGALGDFFMNHRGDIKMGDTPAVTYTLDNAVRNPKDPTQPGWGGAFIPCGGDRPNCWKDDPSKSDSGYDGAATVSTHRKAVLDDWGKMMDRALAPAE